MSIGSITDTTRAQLERLSKDRDIYKVDINSRAILSDINIKHKEIDRVINKVIENKEKVEKVQKVNSNNNKEKIEKVNEKSSKENKGDK